MKNRDSSKFVIVNIKVTPGSYRDVVEGWQEGYLRVRLKQIPEKGQANRKLLEYLAEELDIAPSRLSIQCGEKSRLKRIRIDGLTKEDLNQKWGSSTSS